MIVNVVHCHEDNLIVVLSDGRAVCVRANWRLIDNGVGVHWPDVDEDIGVAGLGPWQAVARGGVSLTGWLAK